jgi:hypothetical protein
MTGISWMLQEAMKCPLVDLSKGEVIDETDEFDYDYSCDVESSKYESIFFMLGNVFGRPKQLLNMNIS